MRKQQSMPSTPPPIPSWTELLESTVMRREPVSHPTVDMVRSDLPCKCGKAMRTVYKSNRIDSYCRACRKELNHQRYLQRDGREALFNA